MTASTTHDRSRTALAHLLAAGLAASIAHAAAAQNSVAINLTGMTIANGGNQTRSSAPATISPDFTYTYVIDGMVRGQGGVLGLTFPSPTPLAQVLETLSPGSSEALNGSITNCAGTHPVAQPPITQSGTQQIGLITVTYAATLQAQINADNTAQFSITNIVLQPSLLVGSLVFTSGTVTLTRTNDCPANCDGSTGEADPCRS
ncbi:hypothetical protein J4558_23915 [Leptolyngbya sp. 15MV]|nr:hypothetical protein J4558_23915 [Leptolyngbya sp. 15MV]